MAHCAIVLPAQLALQPPETLRRWLEKYPGQRLAVPLAPAENGKADPDPWFFSGGVQPLARAAAQAAQIVRQWAEGREIRQESGPSGWRIVAYIAAVIVGLELLSGLIALGISLIGR